MKAIMPVLLCSAVILQGCSLIPGYGPLINLKDLGDNRAQMTACIKKEEAQYARLKEDIKYGHFLKKGLPRAKIIGRYGEPVFSRVEEAAAGRTEVLVYRHPTEYFSSDMIYLHLDDKGRLACWEEVAAPLAEKQEPQEEKTGRCLR